ncbi:hypothetical protein E2562_028247, partial [Oryza meyeriana var. granulata]
MFPAATFSALLRGPPPRGRRLLVAAARAHSTAGGSRARGGLPRFHAPTLPSSKASAPYCPCSAARHVRGVVGYPRDVPWLDIG